MTKLGITGYHEGRQGAHESHAQASPHPSPRRGAHPSTIAVGAGIALVCCSLTSFLWGDCTCGVIVGVLAAPEAGRHIPDLRSSEGAGGLQQNLQRGSSDPQSLLIVIV